MPLCGGAWNSGTNAGVFNINLNNVRTNANSNIGFRSALLSMPELNILRNIQQRERIKEPISAPLSEMAGEKWQCLCVGIAALEETNKSWATLETASNENESCDTKILWGNNED